MNIFTQVTLHSSFILRKKIDTLRRKRFTEYPLFTTFSLFLKVSDNKSPNKIFLQKVPYTLPLFQIKISVLHRRTF